MAVSCVRTVIAKYRTILENQNEWIKPNFKIPQLDLAWNRDYSLNTKNDTFSVNTLNDRMKVKFYKNGFEEFGEELAKKIRGCTSCQQAILCCCRGGSSI